MVWVPEFTELAEALGADLSALDDPAAGRLSGEAVPAWLAEQERWRVDRQASVTPVATTVTADRAVGEWVVSFLSPNRDRIDLPVAVAVEPGSDLPVRIYHSQWPLLGHHVVRPPLLDPDPNAHASDVVGDYKAALAAGDTGTVIACYEPDGYFREPSGAGYRYAGTAVLTDFYDQCFSAGGGIPLTLCRVTEDGVRTAIEFIADLWGSVDMPPQAGIAVYARGPTGRIASAHVYDDVDPPIE
jgi:hypothetical protein